MVSGRELQRTGRKVLVKPFVVLAAKCLGPGRLRLEMVKLAHDLPGPRRRLGVAVRSHPAWVLPLREAFLIQMNDFDRFLEFELRRMLDPVVASGAPRRIRTKSSGSPCLTVVAEALPAVEPVAIPVQPAHLAL